jgi:hypothetical protein
MQARAASAKPTPTLPTIVLLLQTDHSDGYKCPSGEVLEIRPGTPVSLFCFCSLGSFCLSATFEMTNQPANMAYPPPGNDSLPLGDLGLLPLAPPTQGHPTIEESWSTSYTQWIRPDIHNQSVFFSHPLVHDYGNTAHSSNGSADGQTLQLDPNASNTAALSQQQPTYHGISNANMQPMGPPPIRRKRKAPTLRQDDWEPVKARVIELHITKKLPLPEVKKAVEAEFTGFTAT